MNVQFKTVFLGKICCKKSVFCYDDPMLNGISDTANIWLLLAIVWSIPWKGVALWKAARLSHKKWFIVLLVVNTFAILEIIYIFWVAKKYQVVEVEGESGEHKV
jgi:hypothetical protein